MTRIVATFEVLDLAAWEKGFKTHGALLKNQGVISPCGYGYATEGNLVTLNFDVTDVDALKEALKGEIAHNAMVEDGIKPETYTLFIVDKSLDL